MHLNIKIWKVLGACRARGLFCLIIEITGGFDETGKALERLQLSPVCCA